MDDKDEIARKLIEWHLQVNPTTVEAYRFIVDNESAMEEPIKLIEVDTAAVETGKLEAFAFAPFEDITYPVVIAVITPHEWEQIKQGKIALPHGWDLSTARYTGAEQVNCAHAA